jgi:hypothetical protein
MMRKIFILSLMIFNLFAPGDEGDFLRNVNSMPALHDAVKALNASGNYAALQGFISFFDAAFRANASFEDTLNECCRTGLLHKVLYNSQNLLTLLSNAQAIEDKRLKFVRDVNASGVGVDGVSIMKSMNTQLLELNICQLPAKMNRIKGEARKRAKPSASFEDDWSNNVALAMFYELFDAIDNSDAEKLKNIKVHLDAHFTQHSEHACLRQSTPPPLRAHRTQIPWSLIGFGFAFLAYKILQYHNKTS